VDQCQRELPWVKSSLSFANGDCVEVAGLANGGVGLRASRGTESTMLRFTPVEWRAFTGGVSNGEFDTCIAHPKYPCERRLNPIWGMQCGKAGAGT
jgi:hypothetical protein